MRDCALPLEIAMTHARALGGQRRDHGNAPEGRGDCHQCRSRHKAAAGGIPRACPRSVIEAAIERHRDHHRSSSSVVVKPGERAPRWAEAAATRKESPARRSARCPQWCLARRPQARPSRQAVAAGPAVGMAAGELAAGEAAAAAAGTSAAAAAGTAPSLALRWASLPAMAAPARAGRRRRHAAAARDCDGLQWIALAWAWLRRRRRRRWGGRCGRRLRRLRRLRRQRWRGGRRW